MIRIPINFDSDLDRAPAHNEVQFALYLRSSQHPIEKNLIDGVAAVALASILPMVRSVKISGEKFAEVWRQAFVGQDALARAIGMSRSSIFRLTRPGTHGMFVDRFRQLAVFLNIAPEELHARIGAGPNGTPHPAAAENEPTSPAGRIGPGTLHLDAVPEIERDWIEAAAARDGALPAQVMLRLVLKGLAAERRERPDDELGYGEAASPRDSTDDPRPPKTPKKPKRPQK